MLFILSLQGCRNRPAVKKSLYPQAFRNASRAARANAIRAKVLLHQHMATSLPPTPRTAMMTEQGAKA
jgi:hypothetical protein